MEHFTTGAVRDDSGGKLDWTLLPTEALPRVIRHLETGAKHYGRLNFQRGIPVSRCTQSLMRHLVAFLEGKDDEDHLAAVVVNGLFILHMQEVHKESPEINDDPRGITRSVK